MGPSHTYRFGIILCTILLFGCISANMSRPPRNNDINSMADALKYIQDLDTYYGDRARTRFGKRNGFLQIFRGQMTQKDVDQYNWPNKYLEQSFTDRSS